MWPENGGTAGDKERREVRNLCDTSLLLLGQIATTVGGKLG